MVSHVVSTGICLTFVSIFNAALSIAEYVAASPSRARHVSGMAPLNRREVGEGGGWYCPSLQI